ncbi:MAG: NTP transferase domain-containing protein [Candidatus Heimdallarchaeaceae archaeon]
MMKFPVFLFAGRDEVRRDLLVFHDPSEKYKAKSLLPFLGKPLVQWVIDVLEESEYVEKIYVLGLDETDADLSGNLEYVPVRTKGSLYSKYKAGLKHLRRKNIDHDNIVITFSDIPGMTLEGFNQFMEALQERIGYDFVLGVIPADVIEEAIPDSERAVARIGKHNLVHADVLFLSPRVIDEGEDVIRSFSNLRKKRSFKQILKFVAKKPKSWSKLLKIFLKTATLEDAVLGFERAFNCKADVVLLDDPGIGMDMDLPSDYAKLEAYVKKIKK